MSRVSLILLLCCSIAACGGNDQLQVPDPPKVVRVVVKEYVDIPAELDADCYDEAAREQSYGEALRLANLRRESLSECNGRAAKRRALRGKAAP